MSHSFLGTASPAQKACDQRYILNWHSKNEFFCQLKIIMLYFCI